MPSFQAWSADLAGDTCALEFVGGPLDGFKYVVPFPVSQLIDTLALPVNANVVRMLAGMQKAAKRPATSVAIYELEGCEKLWKYRYLGAASVKQCQLEDWTG